ncbi:pyridoxamine 5'-phosphate oxidase [Nocardioides sp. TRM66260-LWL]|uniref:pyridoxamine 5'-phosphate oxidase n=1 Tax=Nocardioides sp. TRM66260-LWL TaxID=2874478 RepID=UPI001CC582A5|nr:pyridoxamine 5'-phosphate oxidase [Nocardioides sp. TRM66260-LWL]MBZ5735208.1 pyridoxamine 5'-phosphate oxidase [Nocardioides sp. TRM66260-LWL]
MAPASNPASSDSASDSASGPSAAGEGVHLDLAGLREDYARAGLDEADVAADPLAQFSRWFDDAVAAGVHEPNAMVVATVDADGTPSARIVLLKELTAEGFVFYTNHGSRKGAALAAEPRCSLLFPWHDLERQVRVEGVAEPLPRATVEAYFAVRPRSSQLGAWASRQSSTVPSRAELEESYADAEARFAGGEVPVPDAWGGYLVRPSAVELWQGRTGRLHDRLVYRRRADGAWGLERLAP